MAKIPLFRIYSDKEDIKRIADIIRSGAYWADGRAIGEFEERIADYIGSKFCVVLNSGTTALHTVLLACGIKEKDEVIVPSFAFIATANAPFFVGAKPVFADIEEETLGLDPKDVEKKITSKTKAIIPLHYGGCPCKIEKLRSIARKYNIILIEDAAESFGARIKDRMTGTFGDAAVLSFCQNKIITTGEGGAIVTNSREIYERSKSISSYGRVSTKGHVSRAEPADRIGLGYNFRMASFVAALGISQLKKADKLIRMRRDNAKYLSEKLNKAIKEIIIPKAPRDYYHVYQIYALRIGCGRDRLMDYLASRGITTKIYFQPAHLNHFYKKNPKKGYVLPVTEKISKEILALPMFPDFTRKEMDYVIKEIKKFYENKTILVTNAAGSIGIRDEKNLN